MQAASRSWPSLIVFEQTQTEPYAGKKSSLDLSDVLMQEEIGGSLRLCVRDYPHHQGVHEVMEA